MASEEQRDEEKIPILDKSYRRRVHQGSCEEWERGGLYVTIFMTVTLQSFEGRENSHGPRLPQIYF